MECKICRALELYTWISLGMFVVSSDSIDIFSVLLFLEKRKLIDISAMDMGLEVIFEVVGVCVYESIESYFYLILRLW